jgi:hypothetical protein
MYLFGSSEFTYEIPVEKYFFADSDFNYYAVKVGSVVNLSQFPVSYNAILQVTVNQLVSFASSYEAIGLYRFAESSLSFEIVSAEVEVAFLGITRCYLKITRAVFERERAAYRSN